MNRILPLSPAFAVTFCGVFLLSLMGLPATAAGNPAKVVLNPYEEVIWGSFAEHKANLHTHTTESDGDLTPVEVVEMYREAGYTIFSITEHDTDEPAHPTWPWEDYGIDVEATGMLPIKGNEISRPDHIGSYFNDYGDPDQTSVPDALQEIGERDGLAVMFHPGRYSNRRDVDFYVDLYETFPHLIGMEVYNQNDRHSGDRELWDNVLSRLMPDRPVWGTGNDDFHRLEHFARSMTIFLMPPGELDEDIFREAFVGGQFYAVHNPSRDTSQILTPQAIHLDDEAIRLEIDTAEENIVWITQGYEIHRGHTLPLDTNLGDYVRVVLKGEEGTRTLLQPFGLGNTEDRQITNLTIRDGSGSGEYLTGSRGIRIEAENAPEGYVFDRWAGDVDTIEDPLAAETTLIASLVGEKEIKATFRPAEKYSLRVLGGSGSGEIAEGSEIWITAEVPEGMVFEQWVGQTDLLANSRSPATRLTMPSHPLKINASFVTEANFFEELVNPDFSEGMTGWDGKEDKTEFRTDELGRPYAVLQSRSGLMNKVEGLVLEKGQRITLYFDAKMLTRSPQRAWVGMQFLSETGEELESHSKTIRDGGWRPLAVSAEVETEAQTVNIYLWMQVGELLVRDLRLRVH
ncbi:MAG: hypothetical protein LAT55_12715 [Opitutales bacterium]|nr:hypothetical protein [Opitutales bacterium]